MNQVNDLVRKSHISIFKRSFFFKFFQTSSADAQIELNPCGPFGAFSYRPTRSSAGGFKNVYQAAFFLNHAKEHFLAVDTSGLHIHNINFLRTFLQKWHTENMSTNVVSMKPLCIVFDFFSRCKTCSKVFKHLHFSRKGRMCIGNGLDCFLSCSKIKIFDFIRESRVNRSKTTVLETTNSYSFIFAASFWELFVLVSMNCYLLNTFWIWVWTYQGENIYVMEKTSNIDWYMDFSSMIGRMKTTPIASFYKLHWLSSKRCKPKPQPRVMTLEVTGFHRKLRKVRFKLPCCLYTHFILKWLSWSILIYIGIHLI